MLKKYELMVILNPSLTEEEHQAYIKKIETSIAKHGGENITKDVWGLRDLAYKIKKNNKGYYVLFKFTSLGRDNKKIEADMNLEEHIYRYLIIRDESEKLLKKIKERDEARALKRKERGDKPARRDGRDRQRPRRENREDRKPKEEA